MAWSLARPLAMLVALLIALATGSARAQEQTFDNIAGPWWFKLAGRDRGALFVEFSEPSAGTFLVEDIALTAYPSFGFSRALASFFVIDAGEELNFDSKGNVIGTLALGDPNSATSVGTISIDKGKPNKDFTRLKLRATLQGESGEPLRVNLDGRRVPTNFAVLSGRDPDGKLGGKGVKSAVFELNVLTSAALGLPGYTFEGSGPAQIDGMEVPDVSMTGTVILSPDRHVFGLLEQSSEFGTGTLSGTLHVPEAGVIPKLKLDARADRKVSAKGQLSDPIEPVLSVTPATFDFGAVRLDATTPPTRVFLVSNVGGGDLPISGSATFQSGSSSDFSFLGAATYGPLVAGAAAVPVTVQFDPAVAGAKSAEILFGVTGSAGSRLVSVTGTGGVPLLTAEPQTLLPFGNVVVLQSRTLFFTLTNTGDGPLEGNATILTGTSDFALVLTDDATNTILTIPYTLQPAEQRLIRVRFTPTTAAQKTGTLNLSGGGGAQRALSGTGTAN